MIERWSVAEVLGTLLLAAIALVILPGVVASCMLRGLA